MASLSLSAEETHSDIINIPGPVADSTVMLPSADPATTEADTSIVEESSEQAQRAQNLESRTPSQSVSDTVGHQDVDIPRPTASSTVTGADAASIIPTATLDTTSYSTRKDYQTQVDGETDSRGDLEEASHQSFADASGDSGTDTSRGDRNERNGHARSNSVKKPLSFKAVSVTKSFLAKAAGAGTTTPTKAAGDRVPLSSGQGNLSGQPSLRPRLVAKSASGLRDGTHTGSLVSKSGSGSTPDPKQVWNRNRPAQPTPPRQFTDEELKQQYGIHLATRLQSDDNGKEAKWADIDEDEDDWAPETIEWNDGTRTAINEKQTPREEVQPVLSEKPSEIPSENQEKPESRPPTFVGPNATVLRVGTSGSGTNKHGSLVLKGAPEKPTLVPKPNPPAPVKSPWAPLPPIDKVPVQISPQGTTLSQPPSRVQRESNTPNTIQPFPPPKEIAADDFTRQHWRDGPAGNRELFNSQSGRYEPVNDARRASIRHDSAFRQPSVLQRPNQADGTAPAEPSAAFQTHRQTSGQEGGWTRRRTGSSTSGQSGSFGRRMSITRDRDALNMLENPHQNRRSSLATSQLEDSISDHRALGPTQILYEPGGKSHIPPALTSPTSDNRTSGQSDTASGVIGSEVAQSEDPIAMQQRIMQESRQLARKRRQEQEEKEEAEKRERIKQRLAALGPAPDKVNRAQQAEVEPTASQAKTTILADPKPSKLPFSETSGGIQQVGLMKIHHPETLVKSPQAAQPRPSPVPDRDNVASQIALDKTLTLTDGHDVESHSHDKVTDTGYLSDKRVSPVQERASLASATEHASQGWQSTATGPEAYRPWGSSGITAHATGNANVWAPINKDRGLGNGLFDQSFSQAPGSQSAHSQRISPTVPTPIGPPSTTNRRMPSKVSQLTVLPPHAPREMENGLSAMQKDHNMGETTKLQQLAKPANAVNVTSVHPGPIGPPAGFSHPVNPWNDFTATVGKQEAEQTRLLLKQRAALREEEARTGVNPNKPQEAFTETWRRVVVDQDAGRRQVVGVTKIDRTSHDLMHSRQESSSTQSSNLAGGSTTSRGSRFFPQPATSQHRSGSNSPPPPDSVSHPAYVGNVDHPRIKLPGQKPVVRLPPSNVNLANGNTALPNVKAEPVRLGSQPLVKMQSWQERFNGLLGKKAHPKDNALPITSSSKVPLEVPLVRSTATVSLPKSGMRSVGDGTNNITSRETEDGLFDDREFGSLPIVKIPNRAFHSTWMAPVMQPRKSGPKFDRQVMVSSIEPYIFDSKPDQSQQGLVVEIRLPGQMVSSSKILENNTISAQHSPRQRNAPSKSWPKRKTPKSKDTSITYSTSKNNYSNPTKSSNSGQRKNTPTSNTWNKSSTVQNSTADSKGAK